MAGTISDLGLTFAGAQSNLSSETIEKLKEADKAVMLKPTENALEKVFTQQNDYAELQNHLYTLSKNAEFFSSELTYLKRSTSYTGDGGSVKVEDGVDPQSGSIHVDTIAKQSVVESKGFPDTSTSINDTDENQLLKLIIDEEEVSIDITPNMTLDDLKLAINDAGNGKVVASTLNTGGEDPYKLIIKSTETGVAQKIELVMEDSDDGNNGSGNDDTTNQGSGNGNPDTTNYFDLGLTTIQEATDAVFTYNGVSITRDTNTVDDLYVGVTINLEKDDSDISFNVTRDLDGMKESMEAFVDSYNEAMTFIGKVTGIDEESGEAGSFQGDYRVNNIQSSINQELFAYEDGKSMTDFGLELTKEGLMIFDGTVFDTQMNQDPAAMEAFFLGETEITPSTYTSRVMGVEYVANSTTINGSQVNTFIEQAMSEDVTIPQGSIKINDIELGEIKLLASNTPAQNAQIVMSAVNAVSDESYVTASLTTGGRQVYLIDESGERFTITSDDNSGNRIGLEEGTYYGKVEEKVGIFANIESYFERLIDGSESTLGLLEQGLSSSEDRLTDELQSRLDTINARYETMASQFAAYNSIISGYQASFSALEMQIEALANAN